MQCVQEWSPDQRCPTYRWEDIRPDGSAPFVGMTPAPCFRKICELTSSAVEEISSWSWVDVSFMINFFNSRTIQFTNFPFQNFWIIFAAIFACLVVAGLILLCVYGENRIRASFEHLRSRIGFADGTEIAQDSTKIEVSVEPSAPPTENLPPTYDDVVIDIE